MPKCPNCGYDTTNPFNFSLKIKNELEKKSKGTRDAIKDILDHIKKYHPLETRAILNFLMAISSVDDQVVRYTINKYYNNKLFYKKGIQYLQGMITSFEKNKEKIKEVERKIYGTRPLEKKIS